MIGTANLFSHSKAMSRVEQFVAEGSRSLTPIRGHQSVSIPAQRGHGGASPLRVRDRASIRNELECSREWLAGENERELIAKVWLVVLDTQACTLDASSGSRAERTRLPIQNVLAREVMLLCCSRGVRFSIVCCSETESSALLRRDSPSDRNVAASRKVIQFTCPTLFTVISRSEANRLLSTHA